MSLGLLGLLLLPNSPAAQTSPKPKDLSSDIYFQMLRKAPGLPGGWFDDASHRSTQPAQQTTQGERPTNQVKAAEALEDQLRDGIAAWLRKDYARAFQVLRPLATIGNSSAQQLLGQMYNTGDGVPQDPRQAVT
jgi:TPR repeat protein